MLDTIRSSLEPLAAAWSEFSTALPAIALALIVFFLGWVLARALRRVLIRVMRFLRVDIAAERAGIDDFLVRGGVRFTVVTIVADLVYWVSMFVVTAAALTILGVHVAAALFERLADYVPHLVIALFIMIFGAQVGRVIRAATVAYLSNLGFAGAVLMGRIAEGLLLIFVVSIALDELAIGGTLITTAFQIGFGALCLALAIAFGLAGKERAAQFMKRHWEEP